MKLPFSFVWRKRKCVHRMSRSRLKMFLIYLMQEADDSCGGKSQIVYLPGGTVVTSTNKRLIKQTDEGTEHHVQFSRVYVVCKYFITLQITLLFATRWVIENNLWPSETTIDSKLLLDVYVRVIIMINFINRISGHANSSQRIQQKRKNNDVANFCFKHCTEAS